MFVAGDLERDGTLIEAILTVLEGARVAACPSQNGDERPVRLGTIEFLGRVTPAAEVAQAAEEHAEPW
jgi:hypothetical protein